MYTTAEFAVEKDIGANAAQTELIGIDERPIVLPRNAEIQPDNFKSGVERELRVGIEKIEDNALGESAIPR